MTVEVKTPFPFCEKCNFRELQESRIYAENKLQESFFYCVNQNKCENVLDLAQRERYAAWLDGRIIEWISVDDRLPEKDGVYLTVAFDEDRKENADCEDDRDGIAVYLECYASALNWWELPYLKHLYWAELPKTPGTEGQNDG